MAIIHPLFKTPQETLELTFGFQYLSSQTFIDGDGKGLSPGVEDNGKSRISALRFTQDWLKRSANQVMAIRSRFSVSIDAFGVTLNNGLKDGTRCTFFCLVRIISMGQALTAAISPGWADSPW